MKQMTATTVGMLLVLWATLATADPWNERTELKFDQPVMVPGATLPPGTYVFQIGNANGARHTVRISREDDGAVIATVQAVPMRRSEATSDIVLNFEPTERGAAPAMKGWYYPGRLYGHEFIYPEEQARIIAGRGRTLVLSGDPTTMSDMTGQGTLHVLDAKGARSDWRMDESLNREWNDWNRTRHQAGSPASEPSATSTARDQATLIQTSPRGMRVALGALLKESDRVTVSGTVRQFVRADVERDWGWLDSTPDLELKLARTPVIVADRIVGGDDQRALLIRAARPATPVGTSGVAGNAAGVGITAQPAVSDAVTLATGDDDMVGRRVNLNAVTVSGVDAGHGFFIGPRERQLFVLTQYLDDAQRTALDAGQNVSVEGFVMQMPGAALPTLHAPGALNRHIYVYATRVH